MTKSKIFCVGQNKTATSSLHLAFIKLGIKSIHDTSRCTKLIEKARAEEKKLLYYLNEYQAFSDHPFCYYYNILDEQYPNSKFILNIRDPHDWIKSRKKHEIKWSKEYPVEPWTDKREKKLFDYFIYKNNEIIKYFKGRSNFMIMDVTKGEGWEKLCPFLEVPVIKDKFPHEGKAEN